MSRRRCALSRHDTSLFSLNRESALPRIESGGGLRGQVYNSYELLRIARDRWREATCGALADATRTTVRRTQLYGHSSRLDITPPLRLIAVPFLLDSFQFLGGSGCLIELMGSSVIAFG